MEKYEMEDDSSALSDYSSCDGSEIDRYSSANSFLGSSSMCSSMGNYTEFPDSVEVNAGCSNGEEKPPKDGDDSDPDSDSVEEEAEEEEKEDMFWGRRIRTWTKSWMSLDRKLGQQTNGGKDIPLSTMSFSSKENAPGKKLPEEMKVTTARDCNDDLTGRADKKDFRWKYGKGEAFSGPGVKSDPSRLLVGESKMESNPLLLDAASDLSSSKDRGVDDTEVVDDVKDSLTREDNFFDEDECLDEIFYDMEEILHDSRKNHLTEYKQGNHGFVLKHSHNHRDGSSTASTSSASKIYPLIKYPMKIDSVLVVGSKQKNGEVSFGERLIGVKEHTVYKLRVKSGREQWEVERRYRDFVSLYHQLNTLFVSHDLSLPSPWSRLDNESRKYFGNTTKNVISNRSILIQDCLSSILNCSTPFGIPSSLVWFLSPSKDLCKSNFLNMLVPESFQRLKDKVNLNSPNCDNISLLNEGFSLFLDIVPQKPIHQLMEKQSYACAGCNILLNEERTLLQDVIWLFGWGKPRLCEYTGQIFCTSCHTGDISVLPAKVLHHWDFSLCSVSRLAKAYLDSIYDKPVLCLRTVNPSLFAKVPALLHVNNIRKKIESMLPFVCCSFHSSLARGLGSRKYLLKNNDLFALRDLKDISKGPFAGVPAILETVLNKILDHIRQKCLICCEMGFPCAAQESCRATSPVILPFEEPEVIKFASCGFIFHEVCIEHLNHCPCGQLIVNHLKTSHANTHGCGSDVELDGFVDSPMEISKKKSPTEYVSDIFSMARTEKLLNI